MSDLELRLTRIERSLRRWKIGAFALVVVVGFAGADFVAKVVEFDTVRCNRIQLLGDSMQFLDKNGDFIGAFGGDGGFACRKINVITKDKKDVCSISSTPTKDGGYDTSVFLYAPGMMSHWACGYPVTQFATKKR